ncbi:MAG TPA: hypothetical protein DCX54_05990 [Flavobacteriales bacterium]|nr:hypothetical protein [Flavobacteriales bacterium]
MKRSLYLVFILLLLQVTSSSGQTTYHMSNVSTSDCEGKLTDSEGGSTTSTYGNNENFTFVICSGGKITMKFNSPFCVDSGFDFLRLFNGPDTNSPLLGRYTGNIVPPTVVATSGCLTAHFKSDGNVTYCGWDADWTTEKIAPIPPVMSINPKPLCNSGSVKINLSKKIRCDSVDPGDFIITGPVSNINVISITSGGNCTSTDSSNVFILQLDKSFSKNCYYSVFMDVGLPDNCDSIWHFILVDSFLVYNCTFSVDLDADPDTICPGMCSDLTATVLGNSPNCLSYTYIWNNGLPGNAGPHTVCPTGSSNQNITYTVSVRSTMGGPIVNASRILYYLNPEIDEPDTITVCQSDTLFFLKALNSGGRFSGPGIRNTVTGLFDPNTAGPGSHLIKYGYPKYCQDSILIIVKAIDAGLPEAACPGAAPFMLKGFTPPGGTWSGDSVTPAGLFNPALSGTYTVTYSVNGCTESKKVTVDSIVLNTPFDTICRSRAAFQISITPPGGRWTGPGITDSVLGIFNPAVANIGVNNLTYKLSGSGNSGCSFSISTYVLEIEASYNFIVCPQQPPITLTGGLPVNGWWTGRGVTDSLAGTYNPYLAFNGNQGNDSVFYHHANGCKDWRFLYVRNTYIIYDTMQFCEGDPRILLNWTYVRNTPGGGVWSGNGLTKFGSSTYYFNPILAGVGTHKLRYTANTCFDSIVMIVYPKKIKKVPYNFLFPDTTVCNTHPNWNFPAMPPGGKWTGKGIVDSKIGTFSPS